MNTDSVAVLDVPPDDAPATKPYLCQIMVSWPYRPDFLDAPLPLEVPGENSERLALMKKLSATWTEPFRSIVHDIPEDAEVTSVSLQDWVPQRGGNSAGRVALIGDAAHAMVMCTYWICYHLFFSRFAFQLCDVSSILALIRSVRGEGANHAITDISNFLHQLLPQIQIFKDPSYPHVHNTSKGVREAIMAYENEMTVRSKPSVLASRQACLDAHQHERINETSPLIAGRIMANQQTVEEAS